MMKPIVITGFVMALVAAGLFTFGYKPAPKVVSVPEGTKAGELSSLEGCDFQPVGSKTKYQAECGTLLVPENWEKTGSPLIALPVVRIPSHGVNTAEPVFFLQGGPGLPNMSWAPPDWLLESHDVILVGYRGIDGTVDLRCPAIDEITSKYTGQGIFSAEANAEYAAAAGQCGETLKAQGIDLSGYTAKGVVEDFEAARRAFGYSKINLWSHSYGTRVAQLYAYMYPQHLHRVIMIGMNTPGHFVYDPAVLDELIVHMSELCKNSPECGTHNIDLAQVMYDVNHNMPEHWLFFPVDADTIRFLTHLMFFSTSNVAMVTDAYLAAAEGDPSGLAMLTLISHFTFPSFHMGDFLNKGGSLDLDYYNGPESIALGDSIMGAPLAEWVWPMVLGWPVELVDASLRQLQHSDVDMLVINGTLDFSTPPNAVEEFKAYYPNARTVLLPEFSHAGDVTSLQPEAFKRLVTSYYNSGFADDSLYEYQPLNFKPKMSMVLMAKMALGVLILLPPMLVSGILLILRRRRRAKEKSFISN